MTSLLLALAISGCQSAPPAQAQAPAAGPAASQPSPDPSSPSQSAPNQSAPSQPAQPGQKQEQSETRRQVPQRRHQLNDLKTAEVSIDKHKFRLWVMDTNDKRMEGMMFLENSDFKDNEGMIFVFPQPEPQRFWMRNTLVPLDIAYVGANRRILNTYTMKALDETTDYSSWGMSDIVIEVRAGLFKKLGIGRNMEVKIPKDLKAID